MALIPLARAMGATVATTTVTTYAYDADGAPTAVTTQVDGGAASTLYLTWDTFVPDAADPTTGTVRPDHGNLAAAGDRPSSSATVYRFDRRDRLVGYAAGARVLTYGYHPDGTMASSATADGTGFSFEYLILRGREALSNGRNYTDPYLEQTKLGAYNEIVVAVSSDEVLATGLVGGRVRTLISESVFGAATNCPTCSRGCRRTHRRMPSRRSPSAASPGSRTSTRRVRSGAIRSTCRRARHRPPSGSIWPAPSTTTTPTPSRYSRR